MEIRYYPDADGLWLDFKAGKPHFSEVASDACYSHFDESGELLHIIVLYASEGVDVAGIPCGAAEQRQVDDYLRRNTLVPIPMSDEVVSGAA